MKRTSILSKIAIILVLLVFAWWGCKRDFLTPSNPSSVTDEQIYADSTLLRLYINGIYNDRHGWDQYTNTFSNIADEARTAWPGNDANNIIVGSWDAVNNPMDNWNEAYSSIRKMNEFFQKIPTSSIPSSTLIEMAAEVHFLRAFMYFDLVKRYGGVPILTATQNLTDSLSVARKTTDETFRFIINELDSAADALPDDAIGGRATKGAAMALKARALLYWASPLYNPSNDAKRWTAAADASEAVINLSKYSLFPNLKTLWLTPNNSESIFEIEYARPNKTAGLDGIAKPIRIAVNDCGQLYPLQELVDAFPMKSGKSITDPSSGYDPDNPYVGRDDRFYADIAYNGATMWGTTDGTTLTQITLDIFHGGRDYDLSDFGCNTITGYYTLKAIDSSDVLYNAFSGGIQSYIELRYAEVLLNYAEAKNEASQPSKSIYDALNLIRTRAGITAPIPENMSQSQLRDFIHHERYVELCFENHRYWDLRRWKTAVATLNGTQKHGVYITKKSNGKFSYKYIAVPNGLDSVNPMVFRENMYFMPIPFDEISKNKNLKQNTGW